MLCAGWGAGKGPDVSRPPSRLKNGSVVRLSFFLAKREVLRLSSHYNLPTPHTGTAVARAVER